MAKDERKRQQKLAKKQKRSKELKKQRNISLNVSTRSLIRSAAERGTWIGCYLFGSSGMYQVYAIRQARSGPVACVFLVDTYCLGVKDAFFNRSVDMEGMRESIAERDMQEVSPAHAMKFIAGAMHYSKDIGFAMHTEADACMMIFGDTNPAECTEDFEYGHNGKPHYLSGPHDSREKQSTILKVLEQLGEGNFHFSMMADDRGTFGAFATSEGLGYEDLDEDDEGYEEADDEDFEDDDYDGATSSRDEQTVDAQSVKDVSR